MSATHFAMGVLVGMAALKVGWFLFDYFTRPRKLSFRDYYDAYYGHCAHCEIERT